MPFSVVIDNDDGTKTVEDVRFKSDSEHYGFPFYVVYLGKTRLGHVASTNPSYSGWVACPYSTPDDEERSRFSSALRESYQAGDIDNDEYHAGLEEDREMFYRWVGRNFHTRRHAAEYLLRVAGYYRWAS